MRDWLLKEEKAKVGRPKLANEDIIKKSKIMISFCFVLCLVMGFMFLCTIKNVSPFELICSFAGEKIEGIITNKDGFIVKEYYDKDDNYVMEIKASRKVKSYSGSYKYTTYYLKNNKWVEHESKGVKKDNFKIVFKSLKNENRTWKIKIQVVNSSGIKKSYAPYSWKFVDAKKMEEKYAYKIFTVKGYYSPVSIAEIKELSKNKNLINVSTKKDNPRNFILNVPYDKYNIEVSYVDTSGKKTIIPNKKADSAILEYDIPNFNSSVKVQIKVWVEGLSDKKLEKIIPSSWNVKKDSKNKWYASNTYILKPESSYKN